MSSPLQGLSRTHLVGLADGLEDGRLRLPCSALALQRYVPDGSEDAVALELGRLRAEGVTEGQLAYFLRLLADERAATQRATERLELVWTGPEVPGAASRDTSVVVRELFSRARSSVLVSGFTVFDGRQVFASLAANMDANPSLSVRLFLNIARRRNDTRQAAEVVTAFGKIFAQQHWPGRRLPAVYYDPRSLAEHASSRAVMHAKCVVIDNHTSLVTSANLTEAAQQRNIEMGLLVADTSLASAIRAQFAALVANRTLRPVPLAR